MKTEEIINKARTLRYKKPIIRKLNSYELRDAMIDISEDCENVKWLTEEETDELYNVLGDMDADIEEFRMMFASLADDAYMFSQGLYDCEFNERFDDYMVMAGVDAFGGQMAGYDTYETDYMPLDAWMYDSAAEEARKRLRRLTKDELLELAQQSTNILINYVSITNRYESLKAAIDILKGQNEGWLKCMKRFNEVYDLAETERFRDWEKHTEEFKKLIKDLPQEVWLR